jgi:hypothetical protein
MNEGSRLGLIVLAVLLVGTLAGCGLAGRSENQYASPYAQYYRGNRGIEAFMVNVPSILYYNGPGDNAANAFTMGVEVRNTGASFSRGGIYISGYDPNMIQFAEVPIGASAGACGISIGSIGFGQLGGIFRCDGVEVSGGAGVTNVRVDNVGKLVNDISNRFGGTKTWWDTNTFDTSLQFSSTPTGNNFVVNFNQGQIEYFNHGRLFIAFLSGISFAKNGGREFLLAGDTYEFPGGELAYLDYNGRIVDWPAGLDQTRQTLLLTSCYQYTTYADPIVCIDPDPVSDHRKVCRPSMISYGTGGNGAPVAITSVEQENTPRQSIFRINIRNVGPGTVYDPGQLEKCSPYSPQRATPADLNVVYLGDVRIGQVGLRTSAGPGGMECYPQIIRLDPNTRSGSTTCKYPLQYGNIKSAYQTPLVVELWYGYSETQQRSVLLKRLI